MHLPTGPVWEPDIMQYDVQVEVSLRPGISDPQGATIEHSLPALGFEGVTGVRVGKSMRFTVEAESADAATAQVNDMCARFLTNPVIEDSTVSVVEAAAT